MRRRWSACSSSSSGATAPGRRHGNLPTEPDPMKVLDLRCGAGHTFEGWFASEDDYGSQRERGLLDCPVCGNAEVLRLPSAPRLNLSGARSPAHAGEPAGGAAPAQVTQLAVHGSAVQRFVEAVAELLKNT